MLDCIWVMCLIGHIRGRPVGDNHLSRRSCRWEASWCSTVRSFSGLMGAAQHVSRVASLRLAASVQCASRKYGSSSSGRPCTHNQG